MDLGRVHKLTVTCQIAGCCPTASIRCRPSFRPQGRCYPAVRDTRFHSGPRSVSAHFSRENDNLYSQERLPLQYFIFSGSNLRFKRNSAPENPLPICRNSATHSPNPLPAWQIRIFPPPHTTPFRATHFPEMRYPFAEFPLHILVFRRWIGEILPFGR